jgi:hypothetical protein
LGYALYLVEGKLGFQMSTNVNPYQYTSYGPVGSDLRGANWHHVAVTVDRDAADGLKLYTDGVLVLTNNPTNQSGDLSNTQPLLIGKNAQSGLNAGFKGGLDELTLYNRALGSNEVYSIYSAGAAGKCFPLVCVPPPTNVVGWWPGDNSTADLGRGHPVVPNANLAYGTGVVFRAFHFNAAGGYAKISTNADLDIGPSGSGLTSPPGRLEDGVAVVNGLFGDALDDQGSPLATPMTIRAGATVLPLERDALADALTEARLDVGPRICLLVHGLMSTESVWQFPAAGATTYTGVRARTRATARGWWRRPDVGQLDECRLLRGRFRTTLDMRLHE